MYGIVCVVVVLVYSCMGEYVCGGWQSSIIHVRGITLTLNHDGQSGCHTHTYHCQLLLLPKKQTKLASLEPP